MLRVRAEALSRRSRSISKGDPMISKRPSTDFTSLAHVLFTSENTRERPATARDARRMPHGGHVPPTKPTQTRMTRRIPGLADLHGGARRAPDSTQAWASVRGGDTARAVLEGPTRVGERLTTPSELQETSLRKPCSKATLCSRFRDDVGRDFPPGTPTSGSHLSDAPNTRRRYREASHRARLAPATVSSKTAAFANPSA